MLGCINRDTVCKLCDMRATLYLALVGPQLEHCVQFCTLDFKKDIEKLGKGVHESSAHVSERVLGRRWANILLPGHKWQATGQWVGTVKQTSVKSHEKLPKYKTSRTLSGDSSTGGFQEQLNRHLPGMV